MSIISSSDVSSSELHALYKTNPCIAIQQYHGSSLKFKAGILRSPNGILKTVIFSGALPCFDFRRLPDVSATLKPSRSFSSSSSSRAASGPAVAPFSLFDFRSEVVARIIAFFKSDGLPRSRLSEGIHLSSTQLLNMALFCLKGLDDLPVSSSSGAAASASIFPSSTVVATEAEVLHVRQITHAEAAAYDDLYQRIAGGKTCIKIDGTAEFQAEVLRQIRELLSTPLGRWVIVLICTWGDPLHIREHAEESYADLPCGTIYLTRLKCVYFTRKSRGDPLIPVVSMYNSPALLHEMMHVLQFHALCGDSLSLSDVMADAQCIEPLAMLPEAMLYEQLGQPGRDPYAYEGFVIPRDYTPIEMILMSYDDALWPLIGKVNRDLHLLAQPQDEALLCRMLRDGNYEKAIWLIAHGIGIKAKDEDGSNPLLKAVREGAPLIIIEALIQAGCDLNAGDVLGITPLHLACKDGDWALVELLLKYQPDTDVPDRLGITPFEYLPPSFMAANGATALHLAVSYAGLDVVRKIMQRNPGAVNSKNGKGKTPMELAQSLQSPDRDDVIQALSPPPLPPVQAPAPPPPSK